MFKLYISKSTDIFFATLQAYGLAEFLYQLEGFGFQSRIQITDIGHSFEIKISSSLDEIYRQVRIRGIANLMAAIVPLNKISETSSRDGLEKYVPKDFRSEVIYFDPKAESFEQFDKDFRYPIWRYICKSHGQGNAIVRLYPALIHIWYAHLQQESTRILLLETILKLFDSNSNKAETEADWLKNVKPQLAYKGFQQFGWHKNESKLSALSIVSPSTISGNETGSASKGIKIHLPQIFWLELYFAFLGLTLVGMPFVLSNGELRLVYPHLKQINFATYRQNINEYRQSKHYETIWKNSSKYLAKQIEILVLLSFRLLSSTSLDAALNFFSYAKQKMHYPSGNSLFSTETGLSSAFADRRIISKFLDIAFSLSIKTPILVNSLYKAMCSNRFEDWLAFLVLHQTEKRPLLWEIVHQIILKTGDLRMNTKRNYADIWSDRGFRRMAKAIYFVTLRAEYLKSQGYETSLKPWYDLKNDLLQSSTDADRFRERLFKFVIDYQETTSRIKANSSEYFPVLPIASHIAVSKLVEEFGSRLLAHALLACAYSIRSKKSTEDIDLKIDIDKLVEEFGSDLVARALIATAYSLRSKKRTQAVEPKNEE